MFRFVRGAVKQQFSNVRSRRFGAVDGQTAKDLADLKKYLIFIMTVPPLIFTPLMILGEMMNRDPVFFKKVEQYPMAKSIIDRFRYLGGPQPVIYIDRPKNQHHQESHPPVPGSSGH